MSEIYLTYVEDRSGGEPIHKGEWDRTDEHIKFYPKSLYAVLDKEPWVETINVGFSVQDFVGKLIDVVIVRYSSGDSFGTSCGNWHIIGAYPAESNKSKEIVKTIRKGKYKGYCPWKGYFEELESVDIETMTLLF